MIYVLNQKGKTHFELYWRGGRGLLPWKWLVLVLGSFYKITTLMFHFIKLLFWTHLKFALWSSVNIVAGATWWVGWPAMACQAMMPYGNAISQDHPPGSGIQAEGMGTVGRAGGFKAGTRQARVHEGSFPCYKKVYFGCLPDFFLQVKIICSILIRMRMACPKYAIIIWALNFHPL